MMKNLVLLTISIWAGSTKVLAFAPAFVHHQEQRSLPYTFPTTALSAGGFEWEDPVEQFDQGVENPFKNPEILEAGGEGSEEGMKIDPARLLGPRLQGSNLYFIGMMGSGKSAVGDIVARSEFPCCFVGSHTNIYIMCRTMYFCLFGFLHRRSLFLSEERQYKRTENENTFTNQS